MSLQKGRTTQSGFTPILILLILPFIVVIGYIAIFSIPDGNDFLSPVTFQDSQNEDLQNWKTYTNNKYNFSFKYPSTFQLGGSNQDKSVGAVIKRENIDTPNAKWQEFAVKVIDNTSLQDTVALYNEGTGSKPNFPKLQTITVNNLTGYQIVDTDEESSITTTFVGNESITISISLMIFSGQDPILINIYNQILSTFRFLEGPERTE